MGGPCFNARHGGALMEEVTRDFRTAGAQCRVWFTGVPSFQEMKTAAVGEFSCDSAEDGRNLLAEVEEQLRGEGFQFMLGPMDGNTWQNYRFVIDSDGSPPFFLEPQNPQHYPTAFCDAGFQLVASYASARAENFQLRGMAGYANRLSRAGITIRSLDLAEPDAELEKMYVLASDAFAKNFLYTPISWEEFLNLYRPVLEKLNPDHVILAEDETEKLQAFLFAIPNWAQGGEPDQLIIKTYASRYPGLGGYLAELIHERANTDGYRSVIHALMHQENKSKRNSEKYGGTFRRYGLFGRKVEG